MTLLAEYKYLGADAKYRKGISQVAVKESPWLKYLSFIELVDNNISAYNMETSDGGASVHDEDDTWNTVNPTWERREAGLAILGDNVDSGDFGGLAAGGQDVMSLKLALKAKGLSQTFDKLAVYGRTTSVGTLSQSKNFKGLLRLIAEAESSTTTDLDGWLYTGSADGANNAQVVVAASGASATLTIEMVRRLRSAVRPKPSHLIFSRLMRDKLEALATAAGTNLEHDKNQLGEIVSRFGEQIVLVDDQIKDNMDDSSALVTAIASYNYDQASAALKDTSPIFAVRMAEDGLCGINGKGMITIKDLGELESKDAKGKRVRFYCGMRLTNKTAAAVLMNCTYT